MSRIAGNTGPERKVLAVEEGLCTPDLRAWRHDLNAKRDVIRKVAPVIAVCLVIDLKLALHLA
jgi:hypothetical protein